MLQQKFPSLIGKIIEIIKLIDNEILTSEIGLAVMIHVNLLLIDPSFSLSRMKRLERCCLLEKLQILILLRLKRNDNWFYWTYLLNFLQYNEYTIQLFKYLVIVYVLNEIKDIF